jgi:hypothetical protein
MSKRFGLFRECPGGWTCCPAAADMRSMARRDEQLDGRAVGPTAWMQAPESLLPLARLRADFLAMHGSQFPHRRGLQFERLLFSVLEAAQLHPRLGYNLGHEQIDGAFTFDTDDYLLEAKWWKTPVERDQADAFTCKIKRRGRNTLGLFLSVSGFTRGFLSTPQDGGTPFIAADGTDLFYVLDGRISMADLLLRKRRHLNETGECLLPVSAMS